MRCLLRKSYCVFTSSFLTLTKWVGEHQIANYCAKSTVLHAKHLSAILRSDVRSYFCPTPKQQLTFSGRFRNTWCPCYKSGLYPALLCRPDKCKWENCICIRSACSSVNESKKFLQILFVLKSLLKAQEKFNKPSYEMRRNWFVRFLFMSSCTTW